MDYREAIMWLRGERSVTNQYSPPRKYAVEIAQVDAAQTQQAYWIVKAHAEKLVGELERSER